MLVLKGLVGLHKTVNFSFFSVTGWGIDLDYRDIEWFALEMNRDDSVMFETTPNFCIVGSFVAYEGYSISSKGLLPTVVDIMVIWIEFTHPSFVRTLQYDEMWSDLAQSNIKTYKLRGK